MYVFGLINLAGLIICILFIPNEMNETAKPEEVAELQYETEEQRIANTELRKEPKFNMTWGTMMRNKHSFFAILIGFWGTFNVVWFVGFIEHQLFALGGQTGLVLGGRAFFYLLCCFLHPMTCEHQSRKFWFVVSFLGFAGVNILMGPSKIFGLPNEAWLISTGLIFQGLFQVFVFIPIIPEMLERLQADLNITEGEHEEVDNRLNDLVNDAYGVLFSASNFLSPLIGTFLTRGERYPEGNDIVFLCNCAFAIVLFIFNCGLFVFSEERRFQEKLFKLRSKLD